MTREELRDYVDEQRGLGNIPYHVYSTLIDGIDTLEQEPCEDVISRQAAIDAINHAQVNFNVESEIDFTKHKREVHEIIKGVLDAQEKALKDLPPVKPEPKKGHWIIYDVHGHKACKCSECNNDVGYPCTDKYCKHCGAKMQGGDNNE